jgi:hypothetical protein
LGSFNGSSLFSGPAVLTTVTTEDTVTGSGVTVFTAVCITALTVTQGVEYMKLEGEVLTIELVVLLEVAPLIWSIHDVIVITGRSYLVFVEI